MKPFGRYQLLRRLAAGGMAEVFLATGPNPVNAELLAVKLIHAHIAEDPGFMAMFVDEARLTAPLAHANLVRIFDLGQAEGRLYLAMEFIRGYPLHVIMQRAELREMQVGPARAAAIVAQAALGLHHAHEAHGPRGELLNLVHRDVSPQNLMLDQDGVVKVVDFGVAKAQGQLATSQKGGLKGKAGYSAPEQLRHKPIDRRADVYALGSVLFELATGEPLFPGKTEAEILQRMLFEPLRDLRAIPGLPPALAAIIERAVALNPDERYPTARALAEALHGYLEPSGVGRPQLAQLMASLFPPFPRTAEEAMAETSPANPRITGATPVVSRPPPGPMPGAADATAITHGGPSATVHDRPALNPAGRPRRNTGGVPAPLRDVRPDDEDERTIAAEAPVITAREKRVSTGERKLFERRPEPSGPQRVRRPETSGSRKRAPAGEGDEETTTTRGSNPDTRTETKPGPAPRRPLPTWTWLVVGAAVGLAGVALVAGLRGRTAPAVPQPAPAVTAVEPPAAEASASGSLTVVGAPGARVRLDGRELGVTPLYKQAVAAGRHKLELTGDKLHKVLSVTVAAHRETVQKVSLEP